MHATRAATILAALALTTLTVAQAKERTTATSAATAAGPKYVVPWIADDYTRAIAEARARKVPLFIEAWAPW
jgi:hypothetical protein